MKDRIPNLAAVKIMLQQGATIDDVLRELRREGATIIESIKLVRELNGLSLAEAKRVVHFSDAWADVRSENEELHADLEKAALEAVQQLHKETQGREMKGQAVLMRTKLQSTSVGVFKRKGKILIQPRNRTTAGVYIGTSPVLMAPLEVSGEDLGRLVLQSFEVAEDGVPHPDDWTKFPHPLWDAAGVRSWSAFSKGTVNCDLYREGAILRIQPMKNMGAKRGFVLLKDEEKSIPSNSPPALVGQEVLRAIEIAESKEGSAFRDRTFRG